MPKVGLAAYVMNFHQQRLSFLFHSSEKEKFAFRKQLASASCLLWEQFCFSCLRQTSNSIKRLGRREAKYTRESCMWVGSKLASWVAPNYKSKLTWNKLWLYPCSVRKRHAVWLSPLCMYVTSPWQIAVGIAVVKMKNHASNVALLRGNREKFFFFIVCDILVSTSLTLRHCVRFGSTCLRLDEPQLDIDRATWVPTCRRSPDTWRQSYIEQSCTKHSQMAWEWNNTGIENCLLDPPNATLITRKKSKEKSGS